MSEFKLDLSHYIRSLSNENDRLKAENHHQAAIIAKHNKDFGSSAKFRIRTEKEKANLKRENILLQDRIKKLENLNSKDSSEIKISSEKEEKCNHQSSMVNTLQARIDGLRCGQKKFAKAFNDLNERNRKILDEKNRELEVLQKENAEILAEKTDRLRKVNQLLAQTGHQIIEIDSLIISNSELKEENSKVSTEKLALETHNNALELQLKHLRRTISEYSTKNAKRKKTDKRKSSSGMVPLPKKNRRKIIVQSDDE